MLKARVISSLFSTAILTLSIGTTCFAQSIPKHMNPGTVIQYDKNSKMKILNKGISTDYKNYDDNLEIELPSVRPGIIVSYDGTGTPTIIRDKNGIKNFEVKENNSGNFITTNNNSYPKIIDNPPSVNWRANGWITWFTDSVGQQNHVLGDYDCATKMGFDNPPCGTTIAVKYNGGANYRYLTKWDIGSLPNAILDIRPYAFVHLFGHDLSEGHFYGSYGY